MNESTPAVDDDDITIDGTDLLAEIKALQAVPAGGDDADLTIDGADLLAELQAEAAPMPPPPQPAPSQAAPSQAAPAQPPPPQPGPPQAALATPVPAPTPEPIPAPGGEAPTLAHWQPSNHWQPPAPTGHSRDSSNCRPGIDGRLQLGAIIVVVVLGLAGAALVWQSRGASDPASEVSESMTTGSWHQ